MLLFLSAASPYYNADMFYVTVMVTAIVETAIIYGVVWSVKKLRNFFRKKAHLK